MLETTMTAEDLLKELKPSMAQQEFIDKAQVAGIDKNTATLIYAAYQNGCNEYNWRAWNAESKYQKLCAKVCENLI